MGSVVTFKNYCKGTFVVNRCKKNWISLGEEDLMKNKLSKKTYLFSVKMDKTGQKMSNTRQTMCNKGEILEMQDM